MKYKDSHGHDRTLTKMQRLYLVEMMRKGHIRLRGRDGFDSTVTARLLTERGLTTSSEWHCPLNPLCLTGLTKLGRDVVESL